MRKHCDYEEHIECAASTIANTAMLDAQSATTDMEALKLRVAAIEAASGIGMTPITTAYINSLT